MPFRHQLTKVQFKFKRAYDTDSDANGSLDALDANTTVELVDAKLYNIKTKGTLTATYDSTTVATATAWSDTAYSATPIVYDVTLNTANPESGSEIVLTDTPSVVDSTDIFLMVPQPMVAPTFSTTPNIVANLSNDPQYLLVTWKVTTGGVETVNTKALYLDECVTAEGGSTQANIDWAKNNFVTYNIAIGPKPIWFTATVTGWDGEQNAYFDVQ